MTTPGDPAITELCAGYGGLGLAVQSVLGGHVALVADNDPGASQILAHRFPGIPNLGDITQTNWSLAAAADIMCAGFPCTDISCAGERRGLREGTRSGVWTHVARAIREQRPPLVVIENVRDLHSSWADSPVEPCPWCLGDTGTEHVLRASGAVCGDLASVGYDTVWTVVSASDTGAPHRRKRVFILAWPAAEDADSAASSQWRQSAPGQAPGGRPWTDAGGPGRTRAAAYPDSAAGRRHEPGSRPGPVQGPEIIERAPVEPGRLHSCGEGPVAVDWGIYEPAIRRWEHILGRPAPRPVEPGRTGERLSPRFVEWMMDLPAGWVTDVPGLSRNDQVKALGNGVVPRQGALAIRRLIEAAPEALGPLTARLTEHAKMRRGAA